MKLTKLSATIWLEGKVYVSKCPELNVASAGDTPSEALGNLKEAVELYLENAKRLGMLAELKQIITSNEKYSASMEFAI
ncbi:type II toxin-antitoxin system HicB family antitoxin [Candidatus Peregrinibacteria bacterium]|nr:type II toxin-antitoxin system HicB family antitoxin [Candidatus Peregrinibacteria bacterium]